MRIFISWSGEASKQVAQALSDWLPDVLQHVRPFMSAADLQPGTRWGPELSRELEQIDFGVCCMTPDNLQRPWIMYEAGALSKKVATGQVVPYLFRVGPSNLEGPLTQFQSVAADREGTLRLVDSIHAGMASNSLTAERLGRAFERWWPSLEAKLAEIAAQPASPPAPELSDKEILKELLLTVRNLQRTPVPMSVALSEYALSAKKRGRLGGLGDNPAEPLYRMLDILQDAVQNSYLIAQYPEFRDLSDVDVVRTFNGMARNKQLEIVSVVDHFASTVKS
ncbi:MAG: toll/interleukin-1 receptor domain-containing protein [Pirellulaceae bacterium]